MPTSKRFYTVRRVSLLFAVLIGFACGPGAEEMGEFFSLFQPETATYTPADSRYIFTPQLYNVGMFGVDDAPDSASAQANTAAWVRYLGSGYSTKLVGEALADTSVNNALMSRLNGTKPEAVTYLRFAYRAQQASGNGSPWSENRPDTVQLTELSRQAHTAAKTTSDPFLKERYAFQAVKLADQAGLYAQSHDSYAQLVKPLSARTFISDWARCRMAGSLLSLGQKDRAVFEFAQVFANCPTRRLAAERSLRHHNLRFTDEALAFAKTDAERVAVYAACAIQPKQDALPLLEKMVELDPKNPLIELVLAREINRNEYYFAAKQFPGYVEDDATRADSVAFEKRRGNVPDYSQQLLSFTQKAADNAKLGNPAFYLTATAYLHYLNGDYNSAKTALTEATQQPTANQSLKQQIALQQMLLLAAQPGLPTAADETELISYLTQFKQASIPDTNTPYITNFRFTNAIQTVGKQLADRYLTNEGDDTSTGWLSGCSQKKREDGDQSTFVGPRQAKAFLMRLITTGNSSAGYSLYDFDAQMALEDSASLLTAQNLAHYVVNPIAEFDERLVKLAGVDADYAYQLVGRRAMLAGNYEVAANAFAKVKPAVWQGEATRLYFAIDPFSVNMPGEGKPRNPYTPVQFAQRMQERQRTALASAVKTKEERAQAWYDLGCGAYNLTYYGNAWIMAHRFRSTGEPYTYRYKASETAQLDQFNNDPYYSPKQAQGYFMQAAKETTNPELAAKATYMAARCEANGLQTRRLVEAAKTGGYVADDDAAFNNKMQQIAAAEYDTHFKIYQTRYRQTQFAQQMQTRCALYRDFMTGE
ncbi:hypothetical protein [Fibrella aquatica]|uniref:hypothetical protein n=1 Tax=Fibrella aquatica TaxID=3242487 RepID=UPI0035208730